MRSLLRAAALVLALATVARAQNPRDGDPLGRLDQATRYAVEMLLDSARLAGLPYGPLESTALEGISKRASNRDIVNAVRRKLRALRDARAALGKSASADELTAAAGVLRVGVPLSELSRLAATRDGTKPLTTSLVVLAHLITRGVPRDTAAVTIFQLWQRGAADDDFEALWRSVERDIVSGTDPGVALLNRARQIPTKGPPSVVPPAVRPEDSKSS